MEPQLKPGACLQLRELGVMKPSKSVVQEFAGLRGDGVEEVVGELKRRPAEAMDGLAKDARTLLKEDEPVVTPLMRVTQKLREMKERRRRLRRLFWRTEGGFCIDGMERGFATIHEGRDWLKMARLAYPNMKKSELKLMRVYVYAKR